MKTEKRNRERKKLIDRYIDRERERERDLFLFNPQSEGFECLILHFVFLEMH